MHNKHILVTFRMCLRICILTWVLLLTYPSLVFAQATVRNSINLAVSPPVTYLTIKPGEAQRHIVTVEQMGTEPLFITPQVSSFVTDGRTGQPILTYSQEFDHYSLQLPSPEIDTNPSLKIQDSMPRGFILQPGEKKNVAIIFNAPETASEREYPLSLLFVADPVNQNRTSPNQDTTQTAVSGSIGSNIIVVVSRTDRDRGALQLESITPPLFVDSLRGLDFEILASNAGINATSASGSAVIRNWRGTIVAQFYFFPDMILANSTRLLRHNTNPNQQHIDYAALSSSVSAAELEQLLATLDPLDISSDFSYKPPFLFGPYSIDAQLFINGQLVQQGYSSMRTIVIALPYSILAILSIIIIGWIGFYTFKT